jgi:hypothetical protein
MAGNGAPVAAAFIVGVAVEDLLQRQLAMQLGVQSHEDGVQAAFGMRSENAEPLAVAGGRADGITGGAVGVGLALGPAGADAASVASSSPTPIRARHSRVDRPTRMRARLR